MVENVLIRVPLGFQLSCIRTSSQTVYVSFLLFIKGVKDIYFGYKLDMLARHLPSVVVLS